MRKILVPVLTAAGVVAATLTPAYYAAICGSGPMFGILG